MVLFAVNAIFTQRIIRALHPNFGWSLVLNVFFFIAVYSVPFIIAYNIVFTVIAFYTLNPHIEAIVRGFLLFGLCYTLSLSLLPILCILPRTFVPHIVPIERFGTGIFRSKIGILLFSTVLLLAGAVVRLASHVMQHTTENPGVIESKQVFYIVGFAFEITVVVLYAICASIDVFGCRMELRGQEITVTSKSTKRSSSRTCAKRRIRVLLRLVRACLKRRTGLEQVV